MAENEQMDNTVETEAQPDTDVTLEDALKEFNVDEEASQFQAPQAPTEVPRQPYVPDPYDVENFRLYEQQQLQAQQALQQNLRSVQDKLTQLEQMQRDEQINKDIGKAVSYVGKKVEGIDPDYIDIALNAEAKRDPRFMAAWNSRNTNPKGWNKVLDGFSKKLSGMVNIKQDPQLTENQLAAKQSQQSMATTTNQKDDWEDLSPAEFEQKWNAM